MYNGNDKLESDLVNSYSWDTAIVFIEKYAEGKSNYANQKGKSFSTSKLNTGKARDVSCNIYDMAANCFEHSTEYNAFSYYEGYKGCVIRGGDFEDDEKYVARRFDMASGIDHWAQSFRTILYM